MNNNLYEKAYHFAKRMVNAYQHLSKEKKEYILSKQLLRSGTYTANCQLLTVKLPLRFSFLLFGSWE